MEENKTFEWYIERMGYVPCYMFPEFMDKDEEFEYYKVKIPRHYIREHIAEGGTWYDYQETDEKGTLDKSVVAGMIHLCAYFGTEYIEEDADFLYYRIRVPIVFLDTAIPGSSLFYREMYEARYLNVKTDRELVEDLAEELADKVPAAGTPMPGMHHAPVVQKIKERGEVHLYEVELLCKNIPECGVTHTEITRDLFGALANRVCGLCGHTNFKLIKVEPLVEEDDNE